MSDDIEIDFGPVVSVCLADFEKLQNENADNKAIIEDLERERAVWQGHFDHMAMQISEQAALIAELVYWLEDAMNFHPEAHKRPVIEACIAKARAVR
jgi:hypothetical protein